MEGTRHEQQDRKGRIMTSRNKEEYHRYDDIIHLPHPVSRTHPQMSLWDRAAQFAPFAALTGHGAAIAETARLTERFAQPDEDWRESLDGKLSGLLEQMGDQPEVTVTFFRPDERKAGGAYVSVSGRIRKVDTWERKLVMEDGTEVPMDYVIDLEI